MITIDEIQVIAPDVPVAVEKRGDTKNPFVSLSVLTTQCGGNEVLEELLKEMVIMSLRYTETVCRFEQIVLRGQQSNENGERKEIEGIRSTVHDATIASINSLARNLKRSGVECGWITKLTTGGRPAHTKFAILIAFEAVLQEGNL